MKNPPEPDRFSMIWREWYGDIPPSHFQLLKRAPERWVRFCALPECAWYERTQKDKFTILRRIDKLASALFGNASEFYVVTNQYEGAQPFALPSIKTVPAPALHWRYTLDTYEEWSRWRMSCNELFPNSGNTTTVLVEVGQAAWSASWYEELMTYRDEDNRLEPDNLFINPHNGLAIGTYDEGFDVFAPKPEMLISYHRQFRAWRCNPE